MAIQKFSPTDIVGAWKSSSIKSVTVGASFQNLMLFLFKVNLKVNPVVVNCFSLPEDFIIKRDSLLQETACLAILPHFTVYFPSLKRSLLSVESPENHMFICTTVISSTFSFLLFKGV